MGEGAARVLSRAGRRSAGLGSDGGARTHTHAVGVRAHGAVCVPQTKRGDVGDGAICSVVVHTRLFDGAKVVFFFFFIRSEMEVLRPRRHTGVRWRFRSTLRVADTAFTGEKEVPLDVARLAGMTCAASERSRGSGIPADDRCVMQGVDTTGTPAQVRCQKPAPPGAKAR